MLSAGNPRISDDFAAVSGGDFRPSRYESQKRRDWNTFSQYLRNHRPPLALPRCSGAHVLEFLRYLDQFGKTKVHAGGCPFFGLPCPPAPCPCPLRQAWGSLDALIGRLRAAFEENVGEPEANPFAARAVRLYLRQLRDSQAKARGIGYEKKKKKRKQPVAREVAAIEGAEAAAATTDHDGGGRENVRMIVPGGVGDMGVEEMMMVVAVDYSQKSWPFKTISILVN